MSYNIGLNIIETNGTATVTMTEAATSTAGFVVKATKGKMNKVDRVTSWVEYVDKFGGHGTSALNDYDSAYAVKGFFDNGGSQAWIYSVTKAERKKAEATVLSTGIENAQKKLHETVDEIKFHVYKNIKKPNLSNVSVEEAVSGTKNFAKESIQILAEIVTYAKNVKESVEFTSETVEQLHAINTNLLDKTKVKIDGIKKHVKEKNKKLNEINNKAIASQKNAAEVKDKKDSDVNKILQSFIDEIFSNRNDAIAILNLLEGWIKETNLIFQDIVKNIVDKIGNFDWGFEAAEAGTWADDLNVEVSKKNNSIYSIQVKLKNVVVENIQNIALKEIPEYLEDNSRYIRFKGTGSVDLKSNNLSFPLSDGKDGVGGVIADDYIKGMERLLEEDIQMLAVPEDHNVNLRGVELCDQNGECIFIGNLEQRKDKPKNADAIKNDTKLLRGDRGKSYGAIYDPWLYVRDASDPKGKKEKLVPPCGHVMGVYARVTKNRGIWKAPAGNEAYVRGILRVPYQYTDSQHHNNVAEASVNGIRFFPGAGIVIDSSRTLSTDSRWRYVNVRRLFNFVKSTLKDGLSWVRQEPNREDLWRKVHYNVVRPFLMNLWKKGAFGTGKPEEVFTIKCDAENNPPYMVDQGIFNLEVYFYPSKPAETIVIQVGQQNSGTTSET